MCETHSGFSIIFLSWGRQFQLYYLVEAQLSFASSGVKKEFEINMKGKRSNESVEKGSGDRREKMRRGMK